MGKRNSPLARDPFVAPPDPPDDIVEGRDPAFVLTYSEARAVEVVCSCGYRLVGQLADVDRDMAAHLDYGHQASRNPALTCQVGLDPSRERWCLRPKNHEGPHWTPDGSHQGRWWPNG